MSLVDGSAQAKQTFCRSGCTSGLGRTGEAVQGNTARRHSLFYPSIDIVLGGSIEVWLRYSLFPCQNKFFPRWGYERGRLSQGGDVSSTV